MNTFIEYIVSVAHAKNRLWESWQFGDVVAVFDISPLIDPIGIPVKFFVCDECGMIAYAQLGKAWPNMPPCGHTSFTEEAYVEMVIQGEEILYRRKA